MANEDKKDFNAMLNDSKDMPKIQIITDEKSIEKYGGSRMYFAPTPPFFYNFYEWMGGDSVVVGTVRNVYNFPFLQMLVKQSSIIWRILNRLISRILVGEEVKKIDNEVADIYKIKL